MSNNINIERHCPKCGKLAYAIPPGKSGIDDRGRVTYWCNEHFWIGDSETEMDQRRSGGERDVSNNTKQATMVSSIEYEKLQAEVERLRKLGMFLATAIDAWDSCVSSHVISDQVRMPRLTRAWYKEAKDALNGK